MNKEEQIIKIMKNFAKEIDKIFQGKTPKIKGPMDDLYECNIYIYRHKGMGNSKQIIYGNPISVIAATISYLETLLRKDIITEEELDYIIKQVKENVKNDRR